MITARFTGKWPCDFVAFSR